MCYDQALVLGLDASIERDVYMTIENQDIKIFLLHSHSDEKVAAIIGNWIDETFNGLIQVFRSSDGGKSIIIGESIKSKIKDELKDSVASIMDDEKKIQIENWRAEYQEVCQSHRAITEFRGKLLALLPLASGTGIYLLITKKNEPLDPTHLSAIGVFGCLVTIGLFFHELRGIGQCGDLIKLGKSLEEKLGLHEGQFTLEDDYYNNQTGFRKVAHEIIGPVGAAWMIYLTMIVTWLYVAVSRFF
jgi:hypothetical protein